MKKQDSLFRQLAERRFLASPVEDERVREWKQQGWVVLGSPRGYVLLPPEDATGADACEPPDVGPVTAARQ